MTGTIDINGKQYTLEEVNRPSKYRIRVGTDYVIPRLRVNATRYCTSPARVCRHSNSILINFNELKNIMSDIDRQFWDSDIVIEKC